MGRALPIRLATMGRVGAMGLVTVRYHLVAAGLLPCVLYVRLCASYRFVHSVSMVTPDVCRGVCACDDVRVIAGALETTMDVMLVATVRCMPTTVHDAIRAETM